MALQAGDVAPEFAIPNQDGVVRKLSELRGRNVLFWWYPKADTPGWTTEGKGFGARIQDFADKNTIVLGVSFDSPADNLAFKQKFSFPFDLLSDQDRKVGMAYGAADKPDAGYAKRISFLIGPDGKIVKVYDPVKPAEHPEQVLADLK